MDKIVKYMECYIPTENCNLRCHYCYITQKRKFNNVIASFSHSTEEMVKAVSVQRMGGKCLFNLCAGGETTLSEDAMNLAKGLLEEGHYVMIVTNGTVTKRMEEMASWPAELKKHLVLKISFHYLELIRLNILNHYFENIKLIRDAGISFTTEITPSDELEPYIDEIKEVCMKELGALPQVTNPRDDRTGGINLLSKHSFREFCSIWETFDTPLLENKERLFYRHRNEFCYAGLWSGYLFFETGDLRQCYCGSVMDNIYRNIDEPLNFTPVGCNCTLAHCFNGHSFLALGDIPELELSTYAELRNRICVDGSEWLYPEVKAFISQKLYENNKELSADEKRKIGSWGIKYVLGKGVLTLRSKARCLKERI